MADLLDTDAGGNITIQPGSTIELSPTPESYGVNVVYHVAQAGPPNGTVIGTFDNVVNTNPLVIAQVLYTFTPYTLLEDTAAATNTITVVLNFMPLSSVINKGNPGAIAKSLDNFTPPHESDMDLVMEQLYFLGSEKALKSALNQMQPSLLNNLSLAQQNSSLDVMTAFSKYTTDLRETRSPCTKRLDDKWRVWGDASIDWALQQGNHQNVGFRAHTELGAGGFDYHIARHFYLGALGAYSHVNVRCFDHLAQGRVNTYYTGLYGSWLQSRFFANASLVASFSNYHSKRFVQFGSIDRQLGSIDRQPRGDHHGYGAVAHLDFGVSLPEKRRAQYYPYGALDYVYQHEKGYTETKAQSLDNNIRGRNTSMLRSEFGVRGKYCIALEKNVIIPAAKLGWVYEARFQGEKINARLIDVPNRYTVKGLYPNRSMLAVGASLTGVLYKQMIDLSLTYEGLFGSGYRSNAGNVSLNIKF
jgi:outer membrane autotransporter protein